MSSNSENETNVNNDEDELVNDENNEVPRPTSCYILKSNWSQLKDTGMLKQVILKKKQQQMLLPIPTDNKPIDFFK